MQEDSDLYTLSYFLAKGTIQVSLEDFWESEVTREFMKVSLLLEFERIKKMSGIN